MELSTVLQNAQSPDQQIRGQAETFLNQAIESQYDQFTLALCAEFATEGRDPASRQLAGLFLKNLATAQDEDILATKLLRWKNCNVGVKEQIKAGFLQALTSPIKQVCHTAAQVLAAFGACDVPNNEWPALLPTLFGFVTNPSASTVLKTATLEALGYMCDAMDPSAVSDATVDQILNTIVDGMRPDHSNEIRHAAITAMYNSIEFTSKNFSVQGERDAIVQSICTCTQCSDVDVRAKALECLATIGDLYYQHLSSYIDSIFRITSAAIQSDENHVGVQAVEFWIAVAEHEEDLLFGDEEESESQPNYNICKQAMNALVPILLGTLTKQNEDADDDSEYFVAEAGSLCLAAFARICDDAIVDLVIPFVTTNIQANDWRPKEAAVMALCCILEGPSEEKLTPIVTQALPVLLACLQVKHNLVKDTAIFTIGKVFEFRKNAVTAESLNPVVQAISATMNDPDAKIVGKACQAVYNMACASQQDSDEVAQTNILSLYFPHLLEKLLMVSNRPDWNVDNMRAQAYEAVNMLIANSAADVLPVVHQVLVEALNRLEASFAIQDSQDRMTLQSLLCSLVGETVKKLSVEVVTPLADRIMQILLQTFNHVGAVAHEDALLTMGYMTDKLGEHVIRYLQYMRPALTAGLKNFAEFAVCTCCIGVIGDLCRALGEQILPMCDEVVQTLMDLLQSSTINRAVKPHAISLFADIAMAIGSNFERYANVVLSILQAASEVTISMNTDEDLVEYIHTLRTSILEAYTGIIMCLKESKKQDMMIGCVDSISAFVLRCFQDMDSGFHNEDVNKGAIGLLGDMGSAFGVKMARLFSEASVQQAVESALKDDELTSIAEYTKQVMKECLGKR